MKKKKKALLDNGFISSNGVCFGNDITMSYTKPHDTIYFAIARALFAFFTSYAVMSMFASFVLNDPEYGAMLFCCLLPVALMCVIRSKNTAIKLIGILFMSVFLLYFLVNFGKIIDGFKCTVYFYLQHAKQPSGILGSSLSGISIYTYRELSSFFIQFMSVIVSILITIASVYRIDFPLLFIVTFPLFELGFYWGWVPPLRTVVILVISWVLMISLHSINQRTNRAGRMNTFAVHEKKHTYYLTSNIDKSKIFFVLFRFIAVLCAAVFIIIIVLSNLLGHERSDTVNSYRRKLTNAFNNFSLEDLGGLFADYDGGFDFFGTKAVGGTNGGKLGNTDGISFNGTTALIVHTKPLKETLYLRGYVGGDYKDNCWDPVEYEDSEEFAKEFSEIGISAQDTDYFKLTDLTNFLNINSSIKDLTVDDEITVEVKGASRKYVYAPYGSYYSDSDQKNSYKMRPYFESYVKLGTYKYSISYRRPENDSFYRVRNALADHSTYYSVNSTVPKEINQKYEKFINDKYTKVTNSDGLEKAYKEINEKYLASGDRSFSSVYYAIKRYFSDNFQYTLEPGKTPSDRDFVDYFLSEQKKGYCSYFASAGVQLLRRFGFKARFVEGYVVIPSLSDKNSQESSIEVTDKCAHAWTEVYIDDFGWTHAEFTPGYDGDNPNMTEDEKNPYKNDSSKNESSLPDSSSSEIESSSESVPESKPEVTTASQPQLDSSSNSQSDLSSSESDSSQSANDPQSQGGNNSGNGTGTQSGTGNNSGIGRTDTSSVADSSSSDRNAEMSSTFKLIMFMLIISALFIFVMILRRILTLKTMQDKCANGKNDDRVRYILRCTLKYIRLLDIKGSENITDMQLCDQLNSQLKQKEIDITKQLEYLFTIAEEAFMGNHEITTEEADKANEYLSYIAHQIIRPKLDPFRYFSAKFVSCLY